MLTKLIDGKALSQIFLQQVKEQVREMPEKPELAAVLIGDDQSSHLYVKLKKKACAECDIPFHRYLFATHHSEQEIIDCLEFLNNDPAITGILVQLPLPKKYHTDNIVSALDYRKDIDGFHPKNRANMKKCAYKILPPLPRAIIELVRSTEETIENKNIAVICNHEFFADPFFCVWGKTNKLAVATLEDPAWKQKVKQADLLIVSLGRPQFITAEMIKDGAIIIDIGINKTNDTVLGDVDLEAVRGKAKFVSPVPGGVGPMTIAMLLQNLVKLKTLK